MATPTRPLTRTRLWMGMSVDCSTQTTGTDVRPTVANLKAFFTNCQIVYANIVLVLKVTVTRNVDRPLGGKHQKRCSRNCAQQLTWGAVGGSHSLHYMSLNVSCLQLAYTYCCLIRKREAREIKLFLCLSKKTEGYHLPSVAEESAL